MLLLGGLIIVKVIFVGLSKKDEYQQCYWCNKCWGPLSHQFEM